MNAVIDRDLVEVMADQMMREFDEWKETLSDEMKLKYRGHNERLFVEVYCKINNKEI